jgi:ABC-type phosphate transport system auxiliary subunit
VLPIPLPAQGKLGERRAREIKADPRRAYFQLLHILSIVVPVNSEKIIEEFETTIEDLQGLPEVTRKLMVQAIDSSIEKLRLTERKLIELRGKLNRGGRP